MLIQTLSGRKENRRGFTLIELAIVLAITALLTVGLWRMMSSANTEMRDQATADQHKQLINAVRAYLASSDGQNVVVGSLAVGGTSPALGPNAVTVGPCAPAAFCNFIPTNFINKNSYNQEYQIRVRKDSGSSYSFMIKTTGGDVIPDTSGGRISSVIGADGGFVYQADVCGANKACGAFGTWESDPVVTYSFPDAAGGQVASLTFVGTDANSASPWLARELFGPPDAVGDVSRFNKLHTTISMNGQEIWGAANGYGGSISNLNTLQLGRAADTGSIPLDIYVPCHSDQDPPPAEGTCDPAANLGGDVKVLGRLEAAALYAGRYIYGTPVSDINLKKDVKPIENALDKFAKIKGYSFLLKNTGEAKYGVISQEVEKVFPDVVHPIESGYKGVDYMGLVGPLVAAVNELRVQNIELRKELDQLKARQK
ncbi:MAG: shufflon system plasmid conjugative transfer pilus tip adhesin PilV [Proteobacteria bacterium]|nr:shufflon system plasmid conjugative transfer pilus tip adhesin PilV [Pseudomonadota bacterium]